MIRRIRGPRTLAPLVAGVAVAGMALVPYVGLDGPRQPAAAVGLTTAPGDSARLFALGHSYVGGLGASRPDKAWPSLVATGTCRTLVNRAEC